MHVLILNIRIYAIIWWSITKCIRIKKLQIKRVFSLENEKMENYNKEV